MGAVRRVATGVATFGLSEAARKAKEVKETQAAAKAANEAAAAQAINQDNIVALEDEKKRKRRAAFQSSLDQTGGTATIADSNVIASRLFGN